LPFWSELEHDAVSVGTAGLSRPVKVSLLIEDQSREGEGSVRAVALRTEVVESRLLALWTDFEYEATAHAFAGGGSTVIGRSIQVSLLVEDKPCFGIRPVDAVVLGTEAVEHTLGLGPCRTHQYTKNQKHLYGASLRK
jgi:hypothetical protein